MKQIIKYFTCEGRYSRVYSYHIMLLMHFTKVKLLNLPYYLFWSIDKMAFVVKKRSYAHQVQSLFHHSLIKMIVLHQLEQQGIPWEVFISHDVFANPQAFIQQTFPTTSHSRTFTSPSSPHMPSPQGNWPPISSPNASNEEADSSPNKEKNMTMERKRIVR